MPLLTLCHLLRAYVTVADYDEKAGKQAAIELARCLPKPIAWILIAAADEMGLQQRTICEMRRARVG